ncbi:MAG TPA: leishmanolysin-related zinc metalloendopeptidase [Longimicrobiales bacterium]|nr:leishmanolysin-related zinc metalloendopeptidase [Longimicrobiales bacterium]
MKQFQYWRVTGLLAAAAWTLACSDSDGPSGVDNNSTAAAASVQASAGATAQSATVGAAVPVAPAVLVRDAGGNVLPGVAVSFTVTGGGGSVANTSATTNSQGIASAGSWTMGPAVGTNTLQAQVGTLPPVSFAATGTALPSPYAVTIRYLATPSARQQQAVRNAIDRWQSVITRDLSDIPVNAPAGSCWEEQPAINERIDDILIFVEFVEIDGVGKILGEAGPCYVRTDNGLPIIGHLKLDAADLRQMENYGTIDDVVMHEIGHVLGIGTLWPDKGLLQGAGTTDPSFLGANAISAYRSLGGTLAAVPVENTGGEGTRDGHWRESVFGNELMTGWVNNSPNPLSAMTIGSLTDLGYGANAGMAGSYTMNARTSSSISVNLHGREQLKRPKFKVDRNGRQEKVALQ